MSTKKIINKFNKRANEWLDDLKQMDGEKILIKPNEKSWSISQVYDHIMKVARTYQIPNMKKSTTQETVRKKRKNKYGIAIFNLGIRKKVQMKIEDFPQPLFEAFTPINRNKKDLIQDFTTFIQEVNALQPIIDNSVKTNKQFHPMFGDLNTKEWFSLVELHLWHHDKQRDKIKGDLGIG